MATSGAIQPRLHLPSVRHGNETSKCWTGINQPLLPVSSKVGGPSNDQSQQNMFSISSRKCATFHRRNLGLVRRYALLGNNGTSFGTHSEGPISWRFTIRRRICSPLTCSKMIVPGFGEKSPEAKAADSLHNFFTFLSVKIVLSQLQAYSPEAYQDLREFADQVSLKDGDRFVAELMRVSPRHKGLALRILEVRSAYAREDFEWENLRRVSEKTMEEANTRLMRDFLLETSIFSDKLE